MAVDAIPPPDRTPAEMLAALKTLVNRQVAQLESVAQAHGGALPIEWDGQVDKVLDRVCKLARAYEPTDEELLAEHDRQQRKDGDE